MVDLREFRETATRTVEDVVEEVDEVLEETESPDEPDPTGETSIEDLTSEADVEAFDRTFTAGDANLTLQGAFDPVAGQKQVLPRVAYTINYNFIWNPDKGRWEPDTGNPGRGFEVLDSGRVTVGSNGFTQFTIPVKPGDLSGEEVILPVMSPQAATGVDSDLEWTNTDASAPGVKYDLDINSDSEFAIKVVNDSGASITLSYQILKFEEPA